ncbi:hypothetical protein [Nocardioides ungokensis]|uniref:hypothetical protein n=1 Tax=Nocardioides ungokensis TaxID=1643322 RepID=UPI0015DEA04C|nr:hypothetical protein [Nocardioides ungokensis]
MTARVFLHVGLPKTGTTYLQGCLWDNKQELIQRGVLLPGRHRRRHLLASLDLREDPKLLRRDGDVETAWQDLVDEASDWQGDVVISHEFFASAAPEHIQRAVASFPDAEFHVIVTARAMVGLGVSRWQEWVKNGGQLGIDSYPPREDYDPTDEWGWGSFDLADILARWGAVVPHERVHVLPMASGGANPRDLWLRFLSVLGLGAEGLEVSEEKVNRSLGLVEVELLRRVNRHLTEFSTAADRGNWIRGYLGEGDVMPDSRERFRPDDKSLERFCRRGEEAMAMLRDGGFDVVGDLALLEPADLNGLRHPSDVTDAELLDAATVTIANLVSDVRSLTRERKSLSHEIASLQGGSRLRVSVRRPWIRMLRGWGR